MSRYDPEHAPNPSEWLELDEQTRIDRVRKYHRRAGIETPSPEMHALMHAVIENQIAEGHAPVVRAMARLASQGLSRHDALHAVASILAEHLFELLRDEHPDTNVMASYDAAVERLTAESWLRS